MEDFVDPSSTTLDLVKAHRTGKLHLIKKIKVTTITKDDSQVETVEFELHDSQSALVHLGKYHKLFTDKLSLDGDVTIRKPGVLLPEIEND
jgi:hypothetical protein